MKIINHENIDEFVAIQEAFQNTDICSFWYYPKRKLIVLTDKTAQIYNCNTHYFDMPQSFADAFVHESTQPSFFQMYEKINSGEKYASASFSNKEQNVWCNVTLTTISSDADNAPEMVYGIVQNMSNVQLQQTESFLHLSKVSGIIGALNNIYIFNYFIDLTSLTFHELTGVSYVTDINGRNGNIIEAFDRLLTQTVDPQFSSAYKYFTDINTLSDRLNDVPYISLEYRSKRLGWVRASFISVKRDDENQVLQATFVVENINQQKQKEIDYIEKIKAFSSIYFATWELDLSKDQVIPILEPEFAHSITSAGQPKKALEVVVQQFVVDDSKREMSQFLNLKKICKELKTQAEISWEYRGVNKGWCRMIFIPIRRDELGNVVNVLMATQGINGQKQKELEYQIQLEKAFDETSRANRAKSDFLSRMSHDMRTPLNGIIGLFEIAEMDPDNIVELRKNRSMAKNAARHLLSLINDILNMSKLEDGRVNLYDQSFNMNELIKQCHEIILLNAQERGVKLNMGNSIIMKHPNLIGSPQHVRQILMNLLSNSIKYNKRGGSITVSVEEKDVTDDTVSWQLTISDTGIGISEEFLEHLFEPFTQAANTARSKFEGTGLGMSIVKELLDLMHGTIQVRSKLGIGTTFVVTIPFKIDHNAKNSELVSVKNNKEIDIKNIKGMHVLLAEDNKLNMEISLFILKNSGATVTIAEDGLQALQCFEQSPPGTFDLILMDIMMPNMDGLEASRRIRALDRTDAKSIPIIALSANAFYEDMLKSKQAGMNEHLNKPVDRSVLLNTIAQYCPTKKLVNE